MVEGAFEAGLQAAVDVGQLQNAVVLPAKHIEVLFQNDLVLGQRPGLVRAQDVDGPEILDGLQTLDDDLALGHGSGPRPGRHSRESGLQKAVRGNAPARWKELPDAGVCAGKTG